MASIAIRQLARGWWLSLLMAGCGASQSGLSAPPATSEHEHHSAAVAQRAATPTIAAAHEQHSPPAPATSVAPATATTAAIGLSGSGEQASANFYLRAGLALIRYEHPTPTPFGMFLMNAQGDHLALLANGAAISGTQSYGIPADGEYYLHVIAEDQWRASVEQLSPAQLRQQAAAPGRLSGSGPAVSAPLRLDAGSLRLSWQQRGRLPFTLVLWDATGARQVAIVSSSLEKQGTTTIELPGADVYLLNVQADGAWTIVLEPG